MRALPPDLADFLAEHHGVASRGELTRLAAAWQVDDLVRHGALARVERGVYRAPGAPSTFHQRARAAVLRSGERALAGPWASAMLHAIEGLSRREETAAPDSRARRTDVVVPLGRTVAGAIGFTVKRLEVPPVDRTSCAGIPCLSPTRTLLEIARSPSVGDRALRVALDDVRRRRLSSLDLLRRRAEAFVRHPGARRCCALLSRPDAGAESQGERRLLPLVEGLQPPPQWQVMDLVPGRRFDLAWPTLALALEYDGRDHHVLPTDRDRDGLRDLESAESGVLVLRITHGMLTEDWEGTRDQVHRVFHRRKAEVLER